MALDTLRTRFRYLMRSAFTELSWWKKRLLQFAVLLIAVGIALLVWRTVTGGGADGSGGAWSWTAIRAGGGCLLGFVAGATMRVFLKLGLLLAAVVAGVMFGLSYVGWVELPWTSFGEIYGAIADVIQREGESFHALVTGYLPSSGMTGMGVVSGVTQRPQLDDD